MIRNELIILLFCMAAALRAEPMKLIFDTDVGNDIDDALALALIHELVDRREVDLLAVTISKDHLLAGPFVDAVNTFYGRPDIPVGVVRDGKMPERGKFLEPIAEVKNEHGTLRYPHDLISGDDAPEAVGLLRKVLAEQPDRSVVLVSVGFFTNFARLLDSACDEVSNLPGSELVVQKVSLYVAMALAFGENPQPEYNVYTDADAARKVLSDWPTPIVASGFEIGLAVTYPAESIEKDFRYVEHHPVAEAYRLYLEMPYDRPTWDLTAVLYAARPDRNYFGISPSGKILLGDRNVTNFTASAEGSRRYLTIDHDQVIRVRELFVEMVSSVPEN